MYRNVFLGAILLSMPLVVWSQQDTIADQRLEEIMVTAKLPLVEISAGKTSYRMDASLKVREVFMMFLLPCRES